VVAAWLSQGHRVTSAVAGVVTAVKPLAEAANDNGVVGPGNVAVTLKVNGKAGN
jgi:hypothetical protein